jgi:ATP-dependent DNA helicase RecQ
MEQEVSPLLRHLPTDLAPPADPVEQRSALDTARAALDATPPTDESMARAVEAWREVVARRARVPVASVLPDRVLRELVAHPPNDLESLSRVEGLGPIKAARFGDELLDVLSGRRASP